MAFAIKPASSRGAEPRPAKPSHLQRSTSMTTPAIQMKHIAEHRLARDLGYRLDYLSQVIESGPQDIAAIHAAAPYLAPLVPQLVDAVYVKLFGYNATKRHFVPRQFGYEGAVPDGINALTLDHEQ